jgi:hypothetical protein
VKIPRGSSSPVIDALQRVDEDWASWYANWLLDLSELSDLLGARPVRSHLVHALVQLDQDHAAAGTDGVWPAFYARRLYERFGGT